jgi:hypothetical protein
VRGGPRERREQEDDAEVRVRARPPTRGLNALMNRLAKRTLAGGA